MVIDNLFNLVNNVKFNLQAHIKIYKINLITAILTDNLPILGFSLCFLL